MYEANLELDRVSRFSYMMEYGGPNRDLNGRRVFIGDLVHVLDINNDYNEWVVMVNGIVPCGTMLCTLGMLPVRYRKAVESNKEARRDRPQYRNYPL